ncbi:hypothetical protein ElyMa_005786800 [Elysia marginata]|uniref:Uncharacterized protein n=1 Tax=Elysia marginata TaxID=1093978 RepID=A0AAV4FRF0_9GAST|nr:hypothetical protein ElyMa_005786800 [Elysia marginata]
MSGYLEMGVVTRQDDPEAAVRHNHELRMRLDKLSRTYDLTTMKIFMTVEALGESNVYSIYDPEKRSNWEVFLVRREACRLDLTRHEKTRDRYDHFLSSVGREEQGRQFFHSMIGLFMTKGAFDVFKHSGSNSNNNKGNDNAIGNKYRHDLETSFCGHLCRLFDKKLDTWFDAFEAVNVRLTAHVKVSNFVRVLTGQVDALCRRRGMLYAINVKVTAMTTPRPLDLMELCMVKAMVIQNGLAPPDQVVLCLLACHLGPDRPVLRLWEYRPTHAMDTAIREADIDRMIDAGRATQHHELWTKSVCPPDMGSLTARQPIARYDMARQSLADHAPNGGGEYPAQSGTTWLTSRTFNTHDKVVNGSNTRTTNYSNSNSVNPLQQQQSSGNYNKEKKQSIIGPSRPLMETAVH